MIHRRDAVLGIALLFVIVLLGCFFFVVFSIGGSGSIGPSKRSVAVIEITGPIFNARPVVEKIERCMKSDRIPVIVIRLNTPGGAVEPTQEIYSTILKARIKGIKVVGSLGSVAASGGYYIAAACDTVMASPATITGSIGVIADFAEFSGLFRKLGIDLTVVKSGKYKDIGSLSRPMTDDEKAIISGVIMDTYDQFIEAVSKGRRMNPETVRLYADGRVFTGRQAKELGFVDALGTYRDAVALAGRIAGLGDDPPVIRDERRILREILSKGPDEMLANMLQFGFPKVSYMMR